MRVAIAGEGTWRQRGIRVLWSCCRQALPRSLSPRRICRHFHRIRRQSGCARSHLRRHRRRRLRLGAWRIRIAASAHCSTRSPPRCRAWRRRIVLTLACAPSCASGRIAVWAGSPIMIGVWPVHTPRLPKRQELWRAPGGTSLVFARGGRLVVRRAQRRARRRRDDRQRNALYRSASFAYRSERAVHGNPPACGRDRA